MVKEFYLTIYEKLNTTSENCELKTSRQVKIYDNFWTVKQRQANRIHEISYRACFKPSLPRYFINKYSNYGDIVYDPFMGRGTTPIEAALMGRIPYGNDIAPLSKSLVEPRINPPSLQEIETRLKAINWDKFKEYKNTELLAFYHPKTLSHLEGLRNCYLNTSLDKVDRWIRMVAINRLTGHSKGFFSVKTMPPNLTVLVKTQNKINIKNNQTPEFKNISELIYKKSKVLLSNEKPAASQYLFLSNDSGDTPQIKDNEVQLTVTSPPFLNIVDYNKDNWLKNWFLNIKEGQIKLYNNIEDWQNFTARTLKELHRITKQGGFIVYETGEIDNGKINLEDIVIKSSKGLPLIVEDVLINTQEFTKTSNCWGITNNKKGTNTNRMVIFKKI
jgi:DNA modification methylase